MTFPIGRRVAMGLSPISCMVAQGSCRSRLAIILSYVASVCHNLITYDSTITSACPQTLADFLSYMYIRCGFGERDISQFSPKIKRVN